jgi:hypothetical protein
MGGIVLEQPGLERGSRGLRGKTTATNPELLRHLLGKIPTDMEEVAMSIVLKKRKSSAGPSPAASPPEDPTPQVVLEPALLAVSPDLAADPTIVPDGDVNPSAPADTPEPVAKPTPKARRPERPRKTERMDIRVTPMVKDFVQDIMDATGFTAGDMLLLGARHMLRDLETGIEVDRAPYTRLNIRRRSSEDSVPDR